MKPNKKTTKAMKEARKLSNPVAYKDDLEFYTPEQYHSFDEDLQEDLIPLYARPQQEDNFRFTIKTISENEDGSANCEVDMDDYTKGKLIELGVISLLKEHIMNQKKQPWYKRWFSFETNCTGNCNQGRSCDCK